MHGAKYRNAARTCDVVFVNSGFTARRRRAARRRRRSGSCVAHPGVERALPPDGERAELGRPYVLTRRDARAAQEPRDAARRAGCPTGHALAVVGAAGWGPQPRARPAGRRPARLRRRRRARAPLPRRGRLRLPVALRGLRDPDRRGDGERRPGRRLLAPVAGRGLAATPRCAPTPTSAERDRRRDRGGARRRDELVPRGLEHARALHVARDRPDDARRILGETARVMRVGIDVSPLVQTRAGTARYVERAARAARRRTSASPSAGRPAGRARARRLVVPARAAARSAERGVSTSSTARPSAGPVRRACPLVVTVHDLAVLRHPETFNQWTRRYSRLAVPRVARAARRVIAVSEFTRARARRAARRAARTRSA